MTFDHDHLVTPTALLGRVREVHASARTAQTEVLVLACAWADAHPEEESPEPYPARSPGVGSGFDDVDPVLEDAAPLDETRGIPGYAWDCAASFAAAIGRTTQAGDAVIRDALVLRHRLPRTWARVLAGEVDAFRARRIAQTVLGAPDDVCAFIDETVSTVAHKVGPVTLDRLLDEAMLRLYPEERELAQLEALDARYVRLDEGSINDTGIADLYVRGDWKDLHDFATTVSEIAAALTATEAADPTAPGHHDSFEVRRSRAVGILADPAQALALLEGDPESDPEPDADPEPDPEPDADPEPDSQPGSGPDATPNRAQRRRARRKRAELVFHVSEDAVAGRDPVGRNETTGRAVLAEIIRDWCGRPDTDLTVLPLVDPAEHVASTAYEVAGRLRTRVDLFTQACVFPWCTRPSRRCDKDHRVAHGKGGTTCDCNLAPLCRRHHRLKTFGGWTYTVLDPGRWLWADPHGQQFLRDPEGTLDITITTKDRRRRQRAAVACRAGPG